MPEPKSPPLITAIILAGGQAQRMGGQDKGLISLKGQPLIALVIKQISPQVSCLLISANRNIEAYESYGFAVIPDKFGMDLGPLAGIATGMEFAHTEYILTLPCDMPYLPADLVQRLWQQLEREQKHVCVAHDGERQQSVVCLLHKSLLSNLIEYIRSGGRKVSAWINQHDPAVADFSDIPEAFININTPDDHKQLETSL